MPRRRHQPSARALGTRTKTGAFQAPVRPGFEEDGRGVDAPGRRRARRREANGPPGSHGASARRRLTTGPACTVFRMHIASSGQSWQSLLLWSSGQQGMSADMVMPSMPAGCACAEIDGIANGGMVRPMVTKTARTRLRSRHEFMPQHPIADRTLEGRPLRIFAHRTAASGGVPGFGRNRQMVKAEPEPVTQTTRRRTHRFASGI